MGTLSCTVCSMLYLCRYRCCVPTLATRGETKTNVATTAVTATVVPTSALRTGTEVRP